MTEGLSLEQKERYFAFGFGGYFLEDLAFRDLDGHRVDLYRCRVCAALTDRPLFHANWHEGNDD